MKFGDFVEVNPLVSLGRKKEYSFVEMANVAPGYRFVEPGQKRVLKGSGAKFEDGDTLFARITPCLENGKIAQVERLEGAVGFGSTEFFVFRGKEGVSDSDFVYYLSLSDAIRLPAQKSMTGASGRQRADIEAIKNIDLSFLDNLSLPNQKQLASVLSNYDFFLKNNSRRIAILEEMAQSLYREWFVHFRFPGHEQAKFIDSMMGQVPYGWQIISASKAIQVNPKTKLAKEGEKPFVPMSGLSEDSMLIGDIQMKSGNSGAKYMNGDTLFSRITPCLQNGKIGYVQYLDEVNPVGFGSTEFIVLRETELLTSEFIYLLARSMPFRENAIKSMTGATGRQRVQNACFDSFKLALPPKALLEKFTESVQPMFKSIFNLTRRNENLKQQRDMLLPKLISGQIQL
ncbi:restriction endonuclease subunit S [Endozoicomonas gorgoniicola]|uniref:Restriction endonuclease subunit S n=1 Tax=Endozoicomonas gorgoniicola TaxID=1234144 RepID=A0ABT3N2R6_9GAMM|nr:restriction endonuclease subunit S [Endozoicomonas gorgoniicola]MCW7555919.1 restriction endonuclease subunit S [Endozoicomonas gorgoniicola]